MYCGLAWAWGPLTVAAPALAWGALACAVPIVVHLVLRPRPRRQPFPALRFLKTAKAAGLQHQRLKHLLLLLCRIVVLALAIGLLMQVSVTPDGPDAAAAPSALAGLPGVLADPVSAVLCIDDSASMGYRFQGRTRLQHGTDWLSDWLNDADVFPPGSQWCVLTPSTESGADAWHSERSRARARVTDLRVMDHGRPVTPLLERAAARLADAEHARHEIFLLTDATAGAWPASPVELPDGIDAVYVLDAGQDEHRSAMIGRPTDVARPIPADRPTSLAIELRSGQAPIDPVVELTVDGQVRARETLAPLGANAQPGLDLPLPALPAGTHAITIALEPADALACDNTRFAVIEAGRLHTVALIGGKATVEVGQLVGAMVAPASTSPFVLRRLEPAAMSGAATFDDVLAVILADIDGLPPAAWERLDAYLRGGGTLLVIPGPNASPEVYAPARALLPAPVEGTHAEDPPLNLAADSRSHHYLDPFDDPRMDSINARQVFKRLVLGDAQPGTAVVARFSNGAPALSERPHGEGRVLLFAFSPAAPWGQFGTQAAPMLVLLHTILSAAAPPADRVATFVAGESAWRQVPDAASSTIFVAEPGGPASRPLEVDVDRRRVSLPTAQAGVYRLRTAKDASPFLTYAVNVPESESDPRRLDPDKLRRMVRGCPVHLLRPGDTPPRSSSRASGPIDLAVPLGLTLLTLLVAETLFANRFYGSRARPTPAP